MTNDHPVDQAPPPAPAASPRLVRPVALGAALHRAPPLPTSLAHLLDGHHGAPAFRQIVEAIFPAQAPAILAAAQSGLDRREARVAAFLTRVEAEHFPVYTLDDWYAGDDDPYDFVLGGIPFVRLGWSDEDYHELDRRDGYRLLAALCQHPYDDTGAPLALLDSLAALAPPATLRRLPQVGFPPETLHARLDGGPFAAAADFADWRWATTGTAFLDCDDTLDIVDAHWTPENVALLTAQWRQADAILARIDALATWLEAEPAAHFAALLDAALREVAADAVTDGGPLAAALPVDADADVNPDGGDHGHNPTDSARDSTPGEQSVPARPTA
jgi:hypothetical protein